MNKEPLSPRQEQAKRWLLQFMEDIDVSEVETEEEMQELVYRTMVGDLAASADDPDVLSFAAFKDGPGH